MQYSGVKGMKDIVPPESSLWIEIENTVQKMFKNFGFLPIITPVVEKEELFTRSVGDVTDIVEKQMYVFKDKSDDTLALRPEGTASIVRSYIEHHLDQKNPYQKLYYWGPMYRYERMQKGRYRQFYQFGAEVFGTSSPKVDAEVIFIFTQILKKIGLDNFEVQINSLGCQNCRPAYRKELIVFLKKQASELCEECQRRLEKNPLRILDCKNENCRQTVKKAPQILKFVCEACDIHFKAVQDSLNQLKVTFVVNPFIVRGLDYYVKTAFEVISPNLGSQNTIGAGGRYDGLVKTLGGADIPAFGFAAGVERIQLLLEMVHPLPKDESCVDLFIAALGPQAQMSAFSLLQDLRLEKNIQAEMDYDDRPLKSQMKKADRVNAKFVLIVGDQELKEERCILRNMSTKEQTFLSLKDLKETLSKKIKL